MQQTSLPSAVLCAALCCVCQQQHAYYYVVACTACSHIGISLVHSTAIHGCMGSISNQPAAGKNSTASKQQLSAWGLPQPILEAFHKKGLKQLYPWQAAALECAAAGNNLVYSAPTSGVLACCLSAV